MPKTLLLLTVTMALSSHSFGQNVSGTAEISCHGKITGKIEEYYRPRKNSEYFLRLQSNMSGTKKCSGSGALVEAIPDLAFLKLRDEDGKDEEPLNFNTVEGGIVRVKFKIAGDAMITRSAFNVIKETNINDDGSIGDFRAIWDQGRNPVRVYPVSNENGVMVMQFNSAQDLGDKTAEKLDAYMKDMVKPALQNSICGINCIFDVKPAVVQSLEDRDHVPKIIVTGQLMTIVYPDSDFTSGGTLRLTNEKEVQYLSQGGTL